MLLIILLRYCFAGLIVIARGLNRILLLYGARVAAAGILSLISRQRRGLIDGLTIPTIPSTALLLPIVTPVLAPMRRNFHTPAGKIGWSLTVVANRNAQHEQADGSRHWFTATVPLERTGAFGYTVRVLPRSAHLANPAELGVVTSA